MKVRDSDVLEWVRGQRKMSHLRTGGVGVAGFHHVTVRSRLVRVWQLVDRLFILFYVFSSRGKRQINETADTESVDAGARL
jgi:hypothetical protein